MHGATIKVFKYMLKLVSRINVLAYPQRKAALINGSIKFFK